MWLKRLIDFMLPVSQVAVFSLLVFESVAHNCILKTVGGLWVCCLLLVLVVPLLCRSQIIMLSFAIPLFYFLIFLVDLISLRIVKFSLELPTNMYVVVSRSLTAHFSVYGSFSFLCTRGGEVLLLFSLYCEESCARWAAQHEPAVGNSG